MFGSKTIALFLVVFCSVQVQCASGIVHKTQGSDHFKEGFLFLGKKSFDKGNLMFAVCDKVTLRITECRIIQRVYPEKGDAHACNITLKGDHEESDVDISLGVVALGKDKAIIYWGEDCNNSVIAKFSTLNLETCKMNEVKIDDRNHNFLLEFHNTDKIVMHDDGSFDIFINDPKRFEDKLGKIQVNADGTVKGEPTASNIKAGLVFYLSPISTRSSTKGYAALRKDDADYALLLIKPDGSEKQLEKYSETSLPAYSAGENVLNVCGKTNADSDVTCKQYDENGNVKYTTIIADANKNIYPKAVHNLPDGGMLIMLAESKQCDEHSTCNNDSKYRIAKIAADGKILGTARIDEFESVSGEYKHTFVYKFGDSEYCAAITGVNPTDDEQKPSDYQILYHCVTEDEFKV